MQEVTFWDVFCDFVKTRMTVEENKTEIDELLDDPVETGIREESVTQGASWSADLPKIKKAIRTKKLKAEPESLASEFNSISLQNQGITKTGKEIGKLKNLKSLSLSVNNLKYVDNLPNLSILNVYGNHIESMEGCTFPTSLVHLGIGFNQISTLKISASSLPELISLDLSWNQLHDLHAVLDAVKALPKLRQLTLLVRFAFSIFLIRF